MANNLRTIRKRILSIEITQQIMKAMKMVAAAKLRRAQERAVGSRPYLGSLTDILGILLSKTNFKKPELLVKREEIKNTAILLYTSNRGLCGSFNNNLIRHAEDLIKELRNEGKETSLYHIGKKGFKYFRKRNYDIAKYYDNVSETITPDEINPVRRDLVEGYLERKFDRLIIVYSKFHSAAMARPMSFDLFPLDIEPAQMEPVVLYEPEHEKLLAELLPEYVKSKVLNAMLESYASEQGSRMTAMEAASKNAGDMLKSMSLEFNKARQALITQELVEITGSAEAVRGSA